MIAGDSGIFAIESKITEAVEHKSQLALGSFVIHVGGRAYGVDAPNASMLGCSFEEVENRLQRRGTHLLPFLTKAPASEIAKAYIDAIYRDALRTDYFGLSKREFADALHVSRAVWAPDGDEAFDDGSHVLQFDVGGRVRLIAFINSESSSELLGTIREEWLEAEMFYEILFSWKTLVAEERVRRLRSAGQTPG